MSDNIENGYGAQALDVEQLNRRYRNAVVSGCAVSDGAGALEIDVAGGDAIVAGTRHSVGATTLTLAAADPDDPRKDVVYVDSSGAPAVATGTPAPARPADEIRRDTYSPAPPDLSQTDACVLAEVWIGTGSSDTDSADISDRRLFADLSGGEGELSSLTLATDGPDLLQFQGVEDWEIDYSNPATALILRNATQGNEIAFQSDGTIGDGDEDLDVQDITANHADFTSVDTEQLNNRTRTVRSGESIQTAVDDVKAMWGVGYVHVPANRTFTESGIEVPGGVRVVGPGDAAVGRNDTPSATIQPAADESVFVLESGRPFVGNIHIDVTNIGTFSSEAILISDQYDYARGWKLYDNIHATGSRTSTNGDAVVRRRSENGNGIAWVTGGRMDIEGFEYGVRDETATDADYVNGNAHDFIAFGGQREVISQSQGTANSEIKGNYYEVGGNGSPNVDSVAVLEGKSTLETWVFDRLNFNTSDVVIINTSGTQIRSHIALTNGEITVNDSPNHIYLSNGNNKFEVGLFGFGHGFITDLSGLRGDWDGEVRRDDGTNTAGYGVFCTWDASNSQWVPMDGSTAFT